MAHLADELNSIVRFHIRSILTRRAAGVRPAALGRWLLHEACGKGLSVNMAIEKAEI